MGCRTNPRLAQSKPPLGKGFRSIDRERQSMGLHCLCAAPHQEIGLTAMQRAYDIIQLFRLRFRHLGTGSIATIRAYELTVAPKTVYIPQLAPTSMKQRACRTWSRI